MARGPLIPGLREYDAPRRRRGSAVWLWILAASVVVLILVVVGGLVAGIGPLRALGVTETPLTAVAWRLTPDPRVIQIAVTLPDTGLCTGDEVVVRGVERATVVEVTAARTAPRGQADCAGIGIAGDRAWADLPLDQPMDTRTVVRTSDRLPLPQEPMEGAEPSPPVSPSPS